MVATGKRAEKMIHRKYHTSINSPSSLCGQAKGDDPYLLKFGGFFLKDDDVQCLMCLKWIEKRGYKVDKLRKHYRDQQ